MLILFKRRFFVHNFSRNVFLHLAHHDTVWVYIVQLAHSIVVCNLYVRYFIWLMNVQMVCDRYRRYHNVQILYHWSKLRIYFENHNGHLHIDTECYKNRHRMFVFHINSCQFASEKQQQQRKNRCVNSMFNLWRILRLRIVCFVYLNVQLQFKWMMMMMMIVFKLYLLSTVFSIECMRFSLWL